MQPQQPTTTPSSPDVATAASRRWPAGGAALLAFGTALFAAGAVAAGGLRLASPIACSPADGCSIQNHVDVDRGPGVRDFGCGVLAYDGHRGTDFQVPDLKRMRAGVPVLAAAAGVVRDVRDGMPDTGKRAYDAGGDTARALGNAVAIDHGEGWSTFYGHLRNGSLRVRRGERIAAGQVLGEIGLSGSTEFPHLHFEVRRDGAVVDPFTGSAAGAACGDTSGSLWDAAARALWPYVPTGVLCAGWASAPPERDALLDDCERPHGLNPSSPAIVAWIEAYGLRQGDRIRITITAPDGSVLTQSAGVVERDGARRFRYAGKKRTAPAWPPGVYRARHEVQRGAPDRARNVLDVSREVELR